MGPFDQSARKAEMWIGSPFPHHFPLHRRVSITMFEKTTFSTDSPARTNIPIPRLELRITMLLKTRFRKSLAPLWAPQPIRIAAERDESVQFCTTTFSVVRVP